MACPQLHLDQWISMWFIALPPPFSGEWIVIPFLTAWILIPWCGRLPMGSCKKRLPMGPLIWGPGWCMGTWSSVEVWFVAIFGGHHGSLSRVRLGLLLDDTSSRWWLEHRFISTVKICDLYFVSWTDQRWTCDVTLMKALSLCHIFALIGWAQHPGGKSFLFCHHRLDFATLVYFPFLKELMQKKTSVVGLLHILSWFFNCCPSNVLYLMMTLTMLTCAKFNNIMLVCISW